MQFILPLWPAPRSRGRRPSPDPRSTVRLLCNSATALALAVPLLACLPAPAEAAGAATLPGLTLQPCRLKGVEVGARCGVLKRPLDPSKPDGVQIDLHVAVLPAVARNPKPDPVFFLAGGPGQSAIELAGTVQRITARLLNRRDIVLVDQRGTGDSAPLRCDDQAPTRSLRDSADPAQEAALLVRCRERLQKLPYGDLRQFTTPIAMADLEAVRKALGYGQINLMGGSYGTRAGLDYLRQFPQQVRRLVLDGVAPPDMVLPLSFSTDAQAALDALFGDCERNAACHAQYPALRSQWQQILASLPREVTLPQPMTGREEKVTLTRDMLTGVVRLPLYAPWLAAGLPLAVQEASEGRFAGLVGLGLGAAGGGRGLGIASGMHFSVVCAEDVPRMPLGTDKPGADFGDGQARMYQRACTDWPRGELPPAFYEIHPSTAPVLLLSGAFDPVTPPRHAARVAKALGPQAVHVVVPNSGHGVMAQGCMRDVVYRFINQDDAAKALADAPKDAGCTKLLPRPPALLPLQQAPATSLAASGAAS